MAHKKILIVDDEKDLRDALEVALTQAGFTTLIAQNGEEALILALTHKPDLILLDIMMPVMTGHEMLNKLRRDPWGKDVPVLILTNSVDPENITTGFGQKTNDYIIKVNASLELIVKRVKQYLAGYHD